MPNCSWYPARRTRLWAGGFVDLNSGPALLARRLVHRRFSEDGSFYEGGSGAEGPGRNSSFVVPKVRRTDTTLSLRA